MSLELVVLAALMGAVTYPARALPLVAPGLERLPPRAYEYLRLIGPAVLAALAAANVAVALDAARRPSLAIGIEWVAVGVGVALVAWRRNLFAGLLAAAALAATARLLGLG